MNSKDTKIALFIPSLRGGGAERVMVNLANEFSERGIFVDLVVANVEGPYIDIVSTKVNIVNLSQAKVLFSLPKLVKYLRCSSPSVLLSTMSHANVIAILATMLTGNKNRIYVREANTISQIFLKKSSVNRFFWYTLLRFFYKKATAVIAPSQGVASDFEREISLNSGTVNVIYNPVVTPELAILANEKLTHPWLESPCSPVLLAVGRLTLQKDYPTLLKAFKIVREKIDAKLIILGEGEDRGKLEHMAIDLGVSDYVDMYGFVKNPFNFMKSADLFVLSSLWEGLPNTLIQAMACGCQVVATDCPSGPLEILNNGEHGSLVPVGDEGRLSVAILDRLNERTVIPDVVERSLFFSVKSSVDAYVALMRL